MTAAAGKAGRRLRPPRGPRRRGPGLSTIAAVLVLTTACAQKAPPRPSGAPAPDPAAVIAHQAATRHCRPLRTATAAIALSGDVGGERVRGRLTAGFAAPASLRLEALAPFGAPALLLASDGAATTLLFPRDKQVLRGASVAELLEAITGLALGADELRDVLFGCLAFEASTGVSFAGGWQAVDSGETRVYLRNGAVAAADHRGWLVDYDTPASGGSRHVRMRRTQPSGTVDLRAVLTQVEMNVDVPASAFALDVPADAQPISLDQLRAASPLAPTPTR
jgi:outer membrane biogenesis lipoprotein LolB